MLIVFLSMAHIMNTSAAVRTKQTGSQVVEGIL